MALFYKAGTSGKHFVRKKKFRMKIKRPDDGNEIKLREFKELIRLVQLSFNKRIGTAVTIPPTRDLYKKRKVSEYKDKDHLLTYQIKLLEAQQR